MNLKDLKLSDLVKIAATVTVAIMLTLNLQFFSNNTTITNNYIQEINKKLEQQDQKLDTQAIKINSIQKTSNDTQGNITQVEKNINKTLSISKEILNQVD